MNCFCYSSIVKLGLTRVVEAQEPSEDSKCKDVGENRENITKTAKIRHDEHALIDGPWCDSTSPWRVRYSTSKQGLAIQNFNSLAQAKSAVMNNLNLLRNLNSSNLISIL